ncbi:TetR family transcriptional regulator [Wenjunlia vitaminophila]|uniref:TetR family transcriptional regulator n=1 Tax=Wenjunlia vitaminophila TaxID=76728 RepID=A0A0T6LRF8_WENVI|nr:TetR/AcrR family transcriptional regulator [Wenjunlia vitaminophila]KRV48707.1 TetR family transcriptional regulator [Wenjunlia vitaminophila]
MTADAVRAVPESDPPPARAPKQDRSRATRRRLLEAAVECLAELGWNGSTVSVVAKRAGVSRGAAQHHFRTREELFAAAVEDVAARRLATVRAHAASLPPAGPRRTEAVVEMLVQLYTGPLFRAALQLWVAATNDERPRPRVTDLEARVGREAHRAAVEFLGADESRPGVRESVQATLDLARGLGLAGLLTDDSGRRARVVRQWARTLHGALHGSPPGDVLPRDVLTGGGPGGWVGCHHGDT